MKHTAIISLLAAAIALGGCADEDTALRGNAPEAPSREVSIPYQVQGEVLESRGVAALSHEKKLERAYVMLFDDRTGEYAGYAAVNVPAGKRTLSFSLPEQASFDTPYRVLALGNADPYAPDGQVSFATVLDDFSGDYAEAKRTIEARFAGKMTASTPGLLPMFGTFVNADGEDSTLTFHQEGENQTVVEADSYFYFSRAVVRVDLLNLVGGLLHIEKVRVINERTAGLFFTDGINAGSQPEFSVSDAGYVTVTDIENTTERLTGALYAFPNMVNTTVQNDRVTTALMIAGYYFDTTTGEYDSELTYYRFNLANVGEAQLLKRNYMYRATIKGVTRRGASDEQTAYNDAAPIFTYDLDEEWDATGDNVTTDEDGNFLIVNKSHLTFDGEANSADFVELRVSTNPELEWHAEWVAEAGHSNERFTFEKLSNEAVKCGPTEVNHSEYVLYGYLRIVAVNPKSGKKLELPIYLVQLSTQNNVKTLTVNGATGILTQELDPMGGTMLLKVITGSKQNQWEAADDGTFTGWDTQGVSFTRAGSTNTYLELTFPANITGETRVATITVKLVNDEEGKVQPVVINLQQAPSPQLLDIINFPESGVLSLECLSLDEGNPSGVVNPRNFIVRLTDARYRYRVSTDFDKNRDLVLSADHHRGAGTSNAAIATQPEDGGVYKDDMIEGLQNNSQFWINPFRTGPGDPTITGTVTVEAYNPDDATARTEKRSFTVRLTSQRVDINDVYIQDSDGSWYMIPDRNYGCPARTQDGSSEPIIASYFDSRQNVLVTNQNPAPYLRSFGGTLCQLKIWPHNGTEYPMTYTPSREQMVKEFTQEGAGNNFLYESTERWGNMTQEFVQGTVWPSRLRYSKGRVWVLSDLKLREGSGMVPVGCWIPATCSNTTWNNVIKSFQSRYLLDDMFVYLDSSGILSYWYVSVYESHGKSVVANTRGIGPYLAVRLMRSLTEEELARVRTELLHQP